MQIGQNKVSTSPPEACAPEACAPEAFFFTPKLIFSNSIMRVILREKIHCITKSVKPKSPIVMMQVAKGPGRACFTLHYYSFATMPRKLFTFYQIVFSPSKWMFLWTITQDSISLGQEKRLSKTVWTDCWTHLASSLKRPTPTGTRKESTLVFFYFVLQVSEKMDRFEKPRTKQSIR